MPSGNDTKNERFRLIPPGELSCLWMIAGVISYKLCDRNYDCENCPFDKVMRGGIKSGEHPLPERIEGFSVPDNLHFHQGHTWVRVNSTDIATIGIDDFAQKMTGPIESIQLRATGSSLKQGEPAWFLKIRDKSIDMLSPIDGKVIAVNKTLVHHSKAINTDPYGKGWVLKVQSRKIGSNLKNLLSGTLAIRWMENVLENLKARVNMDLGTVLGDGGMPVDGIAKSVDRDHWDTLLKEFFLTED